jgi:hypothetical protein
LRYLCGVRWLTLSAVVVVGLGACGTNETPNRLIIHFDAGSDATVDADGPADAGTANDANPYWGQPCIDDGQCDDAIPCTYDSCDRTVGRCLNVPDDTLCDDGIYCNGKETCALHHGCESGPVVSCSDGKPCDIAACVEATKSCVYKPRDVDQDGDPDGHCPGGHDCNDLDPNVSSLHAEVCANGIDDNCNGLIDEMPCVTPRGSTCASAVATAGAGTYGLSTVGGSKSFATSCSVPTPSAGQDVVAAIPIPAGSNVDIDAWATTNGVEVSIALEGACGQPSTELACGSGTGATSVRARARSVAPGTYYAVVTTQSPTNVELKVALLPATSAATNVDCASALPIQPGTPTVASIVDSPVQLPSACTAAADAGAGAASGEALTGALTYSFSLTQTQDVRVYASTVQGSGSPVIGLRDPTCSGATDELSCRTASALPVYRRALPPGTYVVTVAATSPIDAKFLVELSAPTMPPPDQTCGSPPPIGANARISFDLAGHEDAIKDGCFPGGPNAAYDLTLPSASDVLLIDRIPASDEGAVALAAPSCMASVACSTGTTPVRVGKRNVAAGDYRAVVTDLLGLQGTLDALIRPTVPPTIVAAGAADTCATAIDATAGGFFTGDTSTANADYSNSCDAPTSSSGGAPDQVLSLNLSQPQRVVLDMEGSTYVTLLDIRQGPGCPGSPVMGACYVGSGAQKSFLDLELQAGQYWILVDGYQGQKGPWNLDVRVLPP